MKKKIRRGGLFLICFICIFVGIMTACERKKDAVKEPADSDIVESGKQEEMKKIVIAYPTAAAGTEDMKMVEKEVNRLVKEKIGVDLEFRLYGADYNKEINRMFVEEEQLDLLFCYRNILETYIMNNAVWQLDSMLDMYGSKIKEAVGMDLIDSCRIDGKLYGLPNNRDYAVGWDGYIVNKELMDKYNFKAEDIRSEEQLEEVFETIKQNEPEITVVASSTGNLLNNCYFSMKNISVHLDKGRDEKVSNLFTSDEYKKQLKRIRRWYLAGYIDKNPLEVTGSVQKRMGEGSLFAYSYRMKPGVQQQESAACGRKVECIQLGDNIVANNEPSSMQWTITRNSKYPGLAMQVLSLLYNDAEIMNLLSYGIEGVHYEFTEDGHITYPAGKKENIFVGYAWELPNQFITYVWDGNPLSYWEDIREFNKTAIQGCDMGFNFNPAPIYTEYLSIQEIYNDYVNIIGNGLVDPEEALKKMNKEMKENFIDDVIAEEQRQFDVWKATKKEKQ